MAPIPQHRNVTKKFAILVDVVEWEGLQDRLPAGGAHDEGGDDVGGDLHLQHGGGEGPHQSYDAARNIGTGRKVKLLYPESGAIVDEVGGAPEQHEGEGYRAHFGVEEAWTVVSLQGATFLPVPEGVLGYLADVADQRCGVVHRWHRHGLSGAAPRE